MDDISLGTLFIALAVILICSAFFSASETGMMALNRIRLNHLIRKGSKSAKLTSKLLTQTDRLLGSILFGNTLLNAAAASLTGIIILRLFGSNDWYLLGGTIAISFVLLVFSEIMPKVIASSHPERIALFASYILVVLNKLFYPVVFIATSLVRVFLKLLRIKVQADQSKHKVSLEEVRMLVLEGEHVLPSRHQKMLLNLVDIERIAVNDVMVPRNLIEAINIRDTAEVVREQLATCHHTLLPVYENELDNVIGILHVRRVLGLLRHEEFNCEDLRELLQPAYFIPSDTSLMTQLHQFQERNMRVGLVVDEYGELLGLVTLENILEEIVGDFTTESPSRTGKFMRQIDGSVFVEGGTLLRDLNRKLNMHLPLDGAKTLNGLILEHLQDIPESGTSLKINGYPIEIIQTQDRVVKVAKIMIAPASGIVR